MLYLANEDFITFTRNGINSCNFQIKVTLRVSQHALFFTRTCMVLTLHLASSLLMLFKMVYRCGTVHTKQCLWCCWSLSHMHSTFSVCVPVTISPHSISCMSNFSEILKRHMCFWPSRSVSIKLCIFETGDGEPMHASRDHYATVFHILSKLPYTSRKDNYFLLLPFWNQYQGGCYTDVSVNSVVLPYHVASWQMCAVLGALCSKHSLL
jgi:hypothetical protein